MRCFEPRCPVMTHVIWKDSVRLQSTNVIEHSLRNCLHRDANEHRVSCSLRLRPPRPHPLRVQTRNIRKITKCSASDFVLRESDVPKLRCTALPGYTPTPIPYGRGVTTSWEADSPPPTQDHFDENHADDTIRLCRLIRCLVGENFEIVGVGRKEIENREPLEKIWSVLLQNGGFGTQEERNKTFIAWKRKAYERVLSRSTRYFEFRNYFENFHQRR